MLRYKIDVIKALKDAGYNATRILDDRILSQSAMQKLRHKEMVGAITLNQLCSLLRMQPGDLIEWVPGEEDGNE